MTVVAWGYDAYGQLGDGTTGDGPYSIKSAPVTVVGLSGEVTTVAAGGVHSLAIVNGGVMAWGLNDYGQLGDGTTVTRFAPTSVSGLANGVTAIAGGYRHTLAVKDGGVFAWGENIGGRLGAPEISTEQTVPVAVSGLSSGVTAVAAGNDVSLAIKNGGVFAWGQNNFNLLGSGSPADGRTPVPVAGLSSGVTAIATHGSVSLAVKDGGVFAWGLNVFGMIGDGTNIDRATPVPVPGLSNGVTTIACGASHCLAVQNGKVFSWGVNSRNQLGDPTTDARNSPEQVDPLELTNIIAVAASYGDSYALAEDGSLWVWGQNVGGELGLGNTSYSRVPQHLLAPAGYRYLAIDADSEGDHVIATLAAVPEPSSVSGFAMFVFASATSLRRRKRKC